MGLILISSALSTPLPCPSHVVRSGWMHDMGIAVERVSYDTDERFHGVCGIDYEIVNTCEMQAPYYTRMRIYTSEVSSTTIISFHLTNPSASTIHEDRRVTDCRFIDVVPYCGQVHSRFQEAFTYMWDLCSSIETLILLNTTRVLITGHSVGGSLSLFMASKLFWDYNIIPERVYSFAGPFIGDELFTVLIQRPLTSVSDIRQMETVDRFNRSRYDMTSEMYNTDDDALCIDHALICGLYIDPPHSSGLHDFHNYKMLMDGNDGCELLA